MNEVFISATDDVVVGDGDGVDAAPAGLQDVNTLQRPDVPNLTERGRESESQRVRESERAVGLKKSHFLQMGRDKGINTQVFSSGKSELLNSCKLSSFISMATHSGAIAVSTESSWPIAMQC